MNKIVLKLTTAVSTAALLTGSVASVAFGTTTVTVTGNGASSDNTANVTMNTSKNIFQTNTANISNTVNVTANTGGNKANENTGGDASISTGNANVSSSVSNSANSNAATIACGSCSGNTVVNIADNGAHSENTVNTQVNKSTAVTQANTANVTNNVRVNEKTGNNSANENTGGNVDITTGNATGVVNVANNVNRNVAKIGGGTGTGSALEVMITGNGAHSDNIANVGVNNNVKVFQNNDANISNNVDVEANSGHNKANENTGGDTSISTGNANVTVGLNNRANFNGLDLSACDCEIGGTVKVAGNGANSDNTANVGLNSSVLATQTNDFDCGRGLGIWGPWENNGKDCNSVKVDSKTGGNDSNENTQHSSDPMVNTGNAGANVTAGTSANENVIGNMGNITIPGLSNVHDFNGLMLLFMSMFSSH